MTADAATVLMNRIYRRQRHVYNATRRYFLLGRDRVIDRLDARTSHRVLEIGCGTGRNLVLAARRYPDAIFFGIDISTEMLASAIEAIGRAGLSSRVRVAHADAVSFNARRLFGAPRFDRIFISYSLSMIPGWRTVLDLAVVSLAPGGELHVIDFGGQARLPRAFRAMLRRWLSLFHVAPRDRLELELDARARRCGATVRSERLYRDYALYAVLKRPG